MATTSDAAWQERWKREQRDAWSANEAASLCCGWDPDAADNIPAGDKRPAARENIPEQLLHAQVLDKIRRAVTAGALPVLRTPLDDERFYDRAPVLRPADFVAWATLRYPLFPFKPDDFHQAISQASSKVAADAPGPAAKERNTLYKILAPLDYRRRSGRTTASRSRRPMRSTE